MLLPHSLNTALSEQRLLKVIAGLANFDATAVAMVARAAAAGGADLIDVACDPELVQLAAAVSGLPICVSAVEPELFAAAVAAGAAMVEIGNYDAFYPLGRIFDAAEVLELTRRTRESLPEVVLSVTVPPLSWSVPRMFAELSSPRFQLPVPILVTLSTPAV